MADEVSYFEVASFLVEIEAVEISDPLERKQWLVSLRHVVLLVVAFAHNRPCFAASLLMAPRRACKCSV